MGCGECAALTTSQEVGKKTQFSCYFPLTPMVLRSHHIPLKTDVKLGQYCSCKR
jgi:hypothetical protein